MTDKIRRAEERLRRQLGKNGIHSFRIDEVKATVDIYIDPEADADRAAKVVSRDVEGMAVRTIRSAKARLA